MSIKIPSWGMPFGSRPSERDFLEEIECLPQMEQAYQLLRWVAENASDDPSWRSSPVWDAIISMVEE